MCTRRCSGRQERTWTHWRTTSGCVSETRVLCKGPSQPIRQAVCFNQYLGLNFHLLFRGKRTKVYLETQRKSISKWSPEGIPYPLPSFYLVYSDDVGTVTLSQILTPLSPQHVLSLCLSSQIHRRPFMAIAFYQGPPCRPPSPRQGLTEISLPLKGVYHCARLTRAFLKPGFWLFWTESHHKFIILNLNLAF